MPSLAPLRYPIPYPTSQANTMQPKNSSEKNTVSIARATDGGASELSARGASP